MANSNKVFVSPGVYTSEKDLTFVAQSVGVTTLGLVGETLKGPAFEPVLITDFDEFITYFGTTNPAKDPDGNPIYELSYVAKSYLQESNQLFVTRILGLTGYKPHKTFGIKTIGGVIYSADTATPTTGITLVPTATGVTGSTIYGELSGKTATDGESVTNFIVNAQTAGPYNDGDWFTIGVIPTGYTTSLTGTSVASPIGDYANQNWYNIYFDGTDTLFAYLFVYNSGTTEFDVTKIEYDAERNTYDGIVVAALRSRGHYQGEVLKLSITGDTPTITSTDLATNPLADFTINMTTDYSLTGITSTTYTCSLDGTSPHYITKVLGVDVYDKDYDDFPLYVFESYPTLIKSLYSSGLIAGLDTTMVYYQTERTNTDGDFLTDWDTPATPWIVSEVRGGTVSDLFQILTISDGNAANQQVKVTIMNIDLDQLEFDVLVRDYNDTDDNMVVLEKFGRCTMDSSLPGYVGLKIGTVDGEYELKSKYIYLNLNPDHPTDAFPAGFRGYPTSRLGLGNLGRLGGITYKTEYLIAGQATDQYTTLGEPIYAGQMDKYKRVSLGISSSVGYDDDIFSFKGNNTTGNTITTGFHLSVNAATITGATLTGFEFDTTPYDLENQTGTIYTNPLTSINYRKFTFAPCGGFDGWDIYRRARTFGDGYVFGKRNYISGNTDNGGVFNKSVGNSDYYAYLAGIETYANPEAVDINVFATPGINFRDNNSLVNEAINMVENDRADSLYIIGAPSEITTNITSAVAPSEVVDDLDTAALDTNYSATYWPWIQIRDTENSTQLYIPPTGEVCKNIALTDNVSYPWFAVAGYSRGLVTSIKAYKKLTLDDRDLLYKNRINPIATFSDTGTIIWGNKTLQVRESALDRINVRRLLLRARKLISAVSVRLLFEQNDQEVRNEFLRLVNPILDAIKKERGLYDFRVTVSNDPEDYDSNTLRGKIYIKPTRALEFIDIEFIITPTGASFENI